MDEKVVKKLNCEICGKNFLSASELEQHKPKHSLNLTLTPTCAVLETPSPMKELRGKMLETPIISALSPQGQVDIPQTSGLSGINLSALAATNAEPISKTNGSSNPFEASFKDFNAKKIQLSSNSSAWIESVPTPDIINAKISTPQIREALSNVKDSSPLDLSPAKVPRVSEPSTSLKQSGLQLLANTVLSSPQGQIRKSDCELAAKLTAKKQIDTSLSSIISSAAPASMITANTNDALQLQLLRVQQMANQAQQSYLISLPGNKNFLVQPQALLPQNEQQPAQINLKSSQEQPQQVVASSESDTQHPEITGTKAEVMETLRKKVLGNLPAEELDKVRQSAVVASTKRPAESTTSSGDERRKLLLERNRAAAARCREKRKKHIEELEEKNAKLEREKGQLYSELNVVKAEMLRLQRFFNSHQACCSDAEGHQTTSAKPLDSSQSIASSSHSPEVSSPPFLHSAVTSSVECPSD